MFNDLSIKKKLYLGFGSIVAIILILLALAYNNFARLAQANAWDKHTMEVLLQADKVTNVILDIQVQVRGYYLTGDESKSRVDHEDLANVNRELRKMIELTADNPVQQERLKRLDAIANDWFSNKIMPQIERRRALGTTPGAADAMGHSGQLAAGSPIVGGMQKILDEARADESHLLAERTHHYLASPRLRWTRDELIFDTSKDGSDGAVSLPPTAWDHFMAQLP